MCEEKKVTSAIALKDAIDANQHLRVKLSVQKKEIQKQSKEIQTLGIELRKTQEGLNKEQRKLVNIRKSVSYQVGQVFVKAFTKPGKNTLLAPYYLLRIIFSHR